MPLQVERLSAQGALAEISWQTSKRVCAIRFVNGLPFSGQNPDLVVNYIDYIEVEPTTAEPLYFSCWITDLTVNEQNACEMVAVARARWKIENETFNTLKNQGYHLEHNYGHGTKYLATNFAILTFVAFLVDQIAQYLDEAFQKALEICKAKRALWEKVRRVFDLLPAASMSAIFRFIALNRQANHPLLE